MVENPFSTPKIHSYAEVKDPTLKLPVYAEVGLLRIRFNLTRKLLKSTPKFHQRSSLRATVTQYFPSLDKLVEYFDYGYLSCLDKFERFVWSLNLTHKLLRISLNLRIKENLTHKLTVYA